MAQNLVPNPSFEEYIKYPCVQRIQPPNNISEYLTGWYSPTYGTPDIIDSVLPRVPECSSSAYIVGRDSLAARTGQFYVGIFTNFMALRFNLLSDREYIQIKLKQPLEIGKIYRTEF